MYKKISSLVILFVCLSFVYASPVKNQPIFLSQPDGTKIKCFLSGDEFHNWIHDKNDFTIVKNSRTGFYVYAKKENGKLIATDFVVGKTNPLTAGLNKNENIDESEYLNKRELFSNYSRDNKSEISFSKDLNNNDLISSKNPQSAESESTTSVAPTDGSLSNLVLIVKFENDDNFSLTIEELNRIYNDNKDTSISVYNYFKTVSYNQCEVNSYFYPESSNSELKCFQLNEDRGYYESYDSLANSIGYKTDYDRKDREKEFIKKVVNLLQNSLNDFSKFDANNDGVIDNITFVVQGTNNIWSSIFWPHMWMPKGSDMVLGDMKIGSINMLNESVFTNKNLGVICHELFHSMGSPDLYRYEDYNINPIGSWDLMSAPAKVPQHMSSYVKAKYGSWINEIPEITEDGTYTLNPLNSGENVIYKIQSPNSYREYFIVEYRKKNSVFEKSIPGEGLLVYRVCPWLWGNARTGASVGNIPDELYLFRPNGDSFNDGNIYEANFSSDFNRKKFGENSNPECLLFEGQNGGIEISEIGSCGEEISFKVKINKEESQTLRILNPQSSLSQNSSTPLNNEIWKKDSQKFIKWEGLNSGSLKIEFSSDNGNSWENISDNVSAADGKYLWTIESSYSNNCRIKLTSKNNQSLSVISDQFAITDFDWNSRFTYSSISGLSFRDDNYGITSDSKSLYITEDGGVNWKEYQKPLTGTIYKIKINKDNSGWMVGNKSELSIYFGKTNDGGKTWTTRYVPYAGKISGAYFLDKDNGFIYGDGSLLLQTKDGGDNWEKLNFPGYNTEIKDIYFKDQNNGWLITFSQLYYTQDGGKTWQVKINFGYRFFYKIIGLENNSILLLSSKLGSFKSVVKSEDNFNTWNEFILDNESSIPLNMAFANNTQGWATAANGSVFYTENGGESWVKQNTGRTSYLRRISVSENFIWIGSDNGELFSSKFENLESNNPKTPNLVYPQNELVVNTIPNLIWEADASEYVFQISNDVNFSNVLEESSTKEKNIKLDQLNKNGKYFWRVKAVNADGESFWSDIYNFSLTLNNKPESFVLLAPSDGEEIELNDETINYGITFSWSKSADLDGDSIWYCFKTNSTLWNETIIVQDTAITISGEKIIELVNSKGNEFLSGNWTVYATDGKDTVYSSSENLKISINYLVTGISDDNLPGEYSLLQNYPNPFNPETKISFEIPEETHVELIVYDMLGREVEKLKNEEMPSGKYTVNFNASNLASGMYIYRLKTDAFTKTKKMMLVK